MVLSAPSKEDLNKLNRSKREDTSVFLNQLSSQKKTLQNYSLIDYYNLQIESLAEEFDVTLAGRFYRDVVNDVDGNTFRYRVINPTDSVNLTYLLEGKLPTRENEIAVFKTFADGNQLKIGDTLTLNQRSFTITAFIAVPDYIYPIFNYDSQIGRASCRERV